MTSIRQRIRNGRKRLIPTKTYLLATGNPAIISNASLNATADYATRSRRQFSIKLRRPICLNSSMKNSKRLGVFFLNTHYVKQSLTMRDASTLAHEAEKASLPPKIYSRLSSQAKNANEFLKPEIRSLRYVLSATNSARRPINLLPASCFVATSRQATYESTNGENAAVRRYAQNRGAP